MTADSQRQRAVEHAVVAQRGGHYVDFGILNQFFGGFAVIALQPQAAAHALEAAARAADIDRQNYRSPRRNCGSLQSQTRHFAWSTFTGRALH